MSIIQKIANKLGVGPQKRVPEEQEPSRAYDLWAETYDKQPYNLVLDADKKLFASLLANSNLTGKVVADIGCGTGRHWPTLLETQPAALHGFDVSEGMLFQLKNKYPDAITAIITDNTMPEEPDTFFDAIISTLTIAHIPNIRETISAWCRIIQPGGTMIITDFHSHALLQGAKRTFQHEQQSIAIKNYIHTHEMLMNLFSDSGLAVHEYKEVLIDSSHRHFYEAMKRLDVFEQFNGTPVIYGFRLQKDA